MIIDIYSTLFINIIITAFIGIIIIFYIFKLYKNTKKSFQALLEFPPNYKFNSNYLDVIKENTLLTHMEKFCTENNIFANGVIISLSGGVDSMVTLAMLIHFRNKYKFPIFAASIDYGLREESSMESEFLKTYCRTMDIILYVSYIKGISRKKEDSGSRTEFEEESRTIRFDTYKKIISENNLSSECGVFVAHHMDDIVENIFTNSMRGANLLDLEVMKQISTIHGVKLFRPLLPFKKDSIYDFSHTYNVPYFLDTTPKWSRRGKMRNEIFPLLDNVFGVAWRDKLKQLGDQSNAWGNYINNNIIDNWYNECKVEDNDIIIPIRMEPKAIYHIILAKTIHSTGQHMIKNTSVNKLMEAIITKPTKMITLDAGRIANISDNKIYISWPKKV